MPRHALNPRRGLELQSYLQLGAVPAMTDSNTAAGAATAPSGFATVFPVCQKKS